ncbi:Methionine sulfoxide reductase A [Dethiobacter alkaliphilus AHT 1]|uniref:peptide-methionine (S)-S-oxide reductase n=1 Tax=Dethiobacter alkaliphilus AHT 1 TaxID=555088 RepID=C0GJ82_DETAL|nr:Methionine sulfoxide reductase A [Dethiobacter alkaliphilus AHT 1]
MGYAGGSKKNPSYHNLGDHTETIQLEYDPRQITYAQLLDIFWESHNPALARPVQYTSIVFFHNEEQAALARKTLTAREAKNGKLYTTVVAAREFYAAEDYHQKYYLQQFAQLTNELRACYKDFEMFVRSSVAARINGYVAGYGTMEMLEAEIDRFGLTDEGRQALLKHVAKLG